jgi:hypothetical protein
MERTYSDGQKFDTPDGLIEIHGLARDHDRIVYSVEYKDVVGNPVSTLAQEEIESNTDISPV